MTSLEGARILVIEDEGPIALMLEDMLGDMGCVVAGSAATVKEALRCVEAGGFDFALLDINLRDETAEPVADALVKTGIPFALASGYGLAGVPEHLRHIPVLRKPFAIAELEKLLRDTLGSRS
jgi:DNA-binding NtrC family response regulator